MSRSAVLTPSSILSVCPGDEVVIKCYESETTDFFRWRISLEDRAIPTIELPLSNIRNETERQEAGLQFYSKLASYSLHTATLTITAHPVLNGATVICVTAASMDTLTISVTETGNHI